MPSELLILFDGLDLFLHDHEIFHSEILFRNFSANISLIRRELSDTFLVEWLLSHAAHITKTNRCKKNEEIGEQNIDIAELIIKY